MIEEAIEKRGLLVGCQKKINQFYPPPSLPKITGEKFNVL